MKFVLEIDLDPQTQQNHSTLFKQVFRELSKVIDSIPDGVDLARATESFGADPLLMSEGVPHASSDICESRVLITSQEFLKKRMLTKEHTLPGAKLTTKSIQFQPGKPARVLTDDEKGDMP